MGVLVILASRMVTHRIMVLVLMLTGMVLATDRKYRYLGMLQNTVEPLKTLPCNASVGLDLDCSLACGQENNCGAFFVKPEPGPGFSHGACVLITKDSEGLYRNISSPSMV